MSPEGRAVIAAEMRKIADIVEQGDITALDYSIGCPAPKSDDGWSKVGQWSVKVTAPIWVLSR